MALKELSSVLVFATGVYVYLYLGVLSSLCPFNWQQCHRPVQILFLWSEGEILLLKFVSQFFLLKWDKFKDFRERKCAGLVKTFLSPERMNVEAQDPSGGLGWTYCFSVPFRTCSCDMLFLFLHVSRHPIVVNQYYFQGRGNIQNQ